MVSRKVALMNLFAWQKLRCREDRFVESARRRGQNRLINSLETYTLAYVKQKASWTSLFEGRELNPMTI